MLGVIKTAIITIIISFISGVLLDFYKSKAPKVLYSTKKDKPKVIGGEKVNTYFIRIKNASSKTIHDLNLNVQGNYEKFKLDDAKISKGLKFDVSEKDGVYDISIPFLWKNDEFTAKVFAYSSDGSENKPFIALRSPEKIKKVYSEDGNGIGAAISNTISKHKKAMIVVASVLVIVYAGILAGEHFGKIGGKINIDRVKNKINSIDEKSETDDSVDSSNRAQSSQSESINNNSKDSYAVNNNTKNNTNSSAKSSNNSTQSKTSGTINNNVNGTNNTNTTNNTQSNNSNNGQNDKTNSGSVSGQSSNVNNTDSSLAVQQNNTNQGTSSNVGTSNGNTSNGNTSN